MSVTELSAVELASGIASGELKAVDVASAFIGRIHDLNRDIGAFLRVAEATALEQAAAIDERRGSGEALGPLAGVPVALKDNLCVRDEPTTCGSRILENFRPPYDATIVERLRRADAVLIGKTNLDEFAMGSSTENSAFQLTRNPWNRDCIAGGSSGGSIAAVAAALTPLAVGSDTGGSIRQPAALCGVTGMKPSYGRVSRRGLVAYASSLDQIGPVAHSAEDAALLLSVLAGHDEQDSTSIAEPVPDYVHQMSANPDGLRVGVVREQFDEGLDAEVQSAVEAAIDVYRDAGAKIVDVELPHSRHGIAAYYLVATSEASSNLARYDGVHYGYRCDVDAMLEAMDAEAKRNESGTADDEDTALVRMYRQTRSEGFGDEVKRRIMLGTYALSAGYYDAYYLRALKVRRLIKTDYDRAFAQVDLILGPVTPTPAFRIGEKAHDPLAMYLVDLYTVGANLAGICGISLPCGMSTSGLPIGLQLQAPAFGETMLLKGAAMFQRATDWHTRRPSL